MHAISASSPTVIFLRIVTMYVAANLADPFMIGIL